MRLFALELSERIPDLEAEATPEGRVYARALIFARLHGEPLGLLPIDLEDGALAAPVLAGRLWDELADAAGEHLRRDGLEPPMRLDPAGLEKDSPRCAAERESFLAGAPPMTVLIPSRERPEHLRRCVDSILACEYPRDRIDIVVVDSAPRTDATLHLVRSYDGRVRYAREDAPGSASARNRGLAAIRTELVAMTDDDVIVDDRWLTEIARAFAANPAAVCVSGLVLPMALDTAAQVWFEQYGGFTRGFRPRLFDLHTNRPSDEPLYPWTAGLFGTGNNFSFRAPVLRAMGGFDPALGNGTPALGGVDSEILLRTILRGHQIAYEPRAFVHHAHRPEYEALRRQVYAYGAGLAAYYLRTVLSSPRLAIEFARVLPRGIRWMLSPDSHINKHKSSNYPAELTRLERRGMLYGPIGYGRSRYRHRSRRPSTRALIEDARGTALEARLKAIRGFERARARVNPEPVIVLGNHKAGTSAITALLGEITGLTVAVDLHDELKRGRYVELAAGSQSMTAFVEANRVDFSRQIVKENHLTPFYGKLRETFPGSAFALVVRDPRDNLRSQLNRLRLPGDQDDLTPAQFGGVPPIWRLVLDNRWLGFEGVTYIEQLAARWNDAADVYLNHPDDVVLQRYEDFVVDKAGEIGRLASRLGLKPVHDIRDRVDVQYQPRGDRSIAWEAFFGERNLQRIEELCADRMAALGYQLRAVAPA